MSLCASNIHIEPEEATVHGPVEFCARCAAMGEEFGFFTPEPTA